MMHRRARYLMYAVAFVSVNLPSTNAVPTQQPTYREVVQHLGGTQADHTKQPKVITGIVKGTTEN